jgi:hypothetical protein
MDNSLLMGIVLIGVGLALALIAYAVLLYRRENEPKDTAEAEEPPPLEGESLEPAVLASDEPSLSPPPPAGPAPAQPPVDAQQPQPPIAAPTPPPVVAAPPPVVPAPPPALPSTPLGAGRRLLPVAALLREDVTGELVVQVGDRVYRRPEELRGSADANRVQSASADLTRWIAGGSSSKPGTVGPTREEKAAKSASMIEQINTILEEKLAAGSPLQGVRLVEGVGGTVRVFVGVNSYPVDEVPDPQVRQLIRLAVAEWEGRA